MWYYAKDSKKVGPFSDSKLGEFYKKGAIDKSTKVWYKGQKEWVALSESPLYAKVFLKRFSESNGRIVGATEFLRPMLFVYIICSVLWIYFYEMILAHINKITQYLYPSQLEKTINASQLQMTSSLIGALFFLLSCGISYLIFKWVIAAASNARSMKRSYKYGPIFSGVSFFIPFVNLIIPCQVMFGIYSSALEANGKKPSLASYVFIGSWWFFTLFTGFNFVLDFMVLEKIATDVTLVRIYYSSFTLGMLIFTSLIWIVLITRISTLQSKFFLNDRVAPGRLSAIRE